MKCNSYYGMHWYNITDYEHFIIFIKWLFICSIFCTLRLLRTFLSASQTERISHHCISVCTLHYLSYSFQLCCCQASPMGLTVWPYMALGWSNIVNLSQMFSILSYEIKHSEWIVLTFSYHYIEYWLSDIW